MENNPDLSRAEVIKLIALANNNPLTLVGVNLQGLNLSGLYLKGADLRGANLQGANLIEVILENTFFHGANLENAVMLE
jgi:uncharacterized protein YjbI with pentapeptide repeats